MADRAQLLKRMDRSLAALVGGDETKARAWLAANNTHVGGVPAERIRSAEGLQEVVEYLEALRRRP